MEIPKQLRQLQFRFIRIAMDGDPKTARKRPLDEDWIYTNNFNFMRNELQEWIDQGNNYGIATGYGKLAVIDCDEPEIEIIVENRLPQTFTVQTGSGGMHYYFIIPDLEKKITMKDKDGKHYGEIQWMGQQVIGPGSLHQSNNKYLVINDSPIVEISNSKIHDVLYNYIQKKTTISKTLINVNYQHVDLSKIIDLSNFQLIGNEYVGSHPIHGSTTGSNFRVNTQKGQWHCFRCDCGGGVISLIAILNGLIQCGDPITNEIRCKVLELAKEKYGVEIKDG